MAEMDEYWSGVDTDLKYIDDQAKKLQDDSRLQMNIKDLMRKWEGGKKDFKQYINAVRAVRA